MSLSLRAPSRAGSTGCSARGSISAAVAVLVVLLMIVAGLSLLTIIPRPTGSNAPASGVTPAAAPPFTHGDLNVTSGETFVIQPTAGARTYYQGGNITVFSGGTLVVRNVTLSFVQFVSDSGTPLQRLSHIDRFLVDAGGTVNLYNATLTTDVQVLNAWAKLNLTIEGAVTAWHSTLAFPGWINVKGSSADLTLNSSAITANPAVAGLSEPTTIQADTEFAASISVTGGAELNVLASTIDDTYADTTCTAACAPQPAPLGTGGTLLGTGDNNLSALSTPSDSANLTQDWLYPQANFQAGDVFVTWINPGVVNATTNLYVWYAGTSYFLEALVFAAGGGGTFEVPLPATLLQVITHDGVLNYLNWTGDFGAGPSRIAIDFQNFAGPSVGLISAYLSLLPTPQYNIVVSGAGSTLNSVDSSFGLTWSAPPASPTSQLAPFPWNSNKILLTGGAYGYFANATVLSPPPGVFGHSAVLPDATSEAFFYRWAQFNLTGRGGFLPIDGARVSAYYAYSSNQANNATANALNNLATANPEIWGYVQYWDAQHGVAKYGSSNSAGVGSVLLASSNITAATLPDGFFLGGYHIGIIVPAAGVGSHWFNWSVSPYPQGVAKQPPAVAGPDFAPNQVFNTYFGAAALSSVSVLANGVVSNTIDLGQTLGVQVTVEDLGTVPITQIAGDLFYNATSSPSGLLASYQATNLDLTAPGQLANFTLSWKATENVTGLLGWFKHNLSLSVEWNDGSASLGGGVLGQNVSLGFAPSQIAITAFSLPPTTLDLGQSYISVGTLVFNGSRTASVELIATPIGGGSNVTIAATVALAGRFSMPWVSLQGQLNPGTTYRLTAQASYNSRETNYTLPGTYAVPPTPTSPASFLLQKFLGLPLWAWLAIAAAAVVAIVLFLFVARRQAAGKLVECGECGNLIPEDATVCPKCGAEFESDLIRCSRCASTIPADSKFCPECAAQLLGTPGEAAADPEKQAYADFTEKYRAEAKRELGDNYSEGAFWDWWKRQPTYTPFSQWSLQQGTGTARAGMTAPPAGTETTEEVAPGRMPPKGGGGAAAAAPSAPTTAAPPAPPAAIVPPPAAGGAGLKACPSCGKEIPSEYLVCPFCNAVTQ